MTATKENGFEIGSLVAIYSDVCGFWCDGVVTETDDDHFKVRYLIPGVGRRLSRALPWDTSQVRASNVEGN